MNNKNAQTSNTQASVPLCVDLDGTLLKTDTLYELTLRLIKHNPLRLLCLPFIVLQCLSKGKQHLKQYLIARISLDPASLPYNEELLSFLQHEKQNNRPIHLVTGCHETLAKKIADHLDLFTDVIATNSSINLTGKNKSTELTKRFGAGGFDYAGNSKVDIPVWKESREQILVNASRSLRNKLQSKIDFERTFDERSFSLLLLIKGLRIHQWTKNALIFLPALTSHTLSDFNVFTTLVLAFFAFGCCASFNYIINDLLDLEDDRKHHSKRYRPFASGRIAIPHALLLILLLISATIFLVQPLPMDFTWLLLVYLLVTNLYSFRLKQVPILDVSILAGLYTMRVIIGTVAIDISLSFWLVAFSAFLFFSLAIIKRLSELLHHKTQGKSQVKARGYIAEDIPTLYSLGGGSAIAAVMVLALYINSANVRVLYSSPNHLWLLCPVLLLWLGRAWLITGRGRMHDDPVVFALKDRTSWFIFILGAIVMYSAAFN